MRTRGLLVRALRWLRRLFRRKKQWYEIDMTRLKRINRNFLADICADGDFAAVVGRPDVRVREMQA